MTNNNTVDRMRLDEVISWCSQRGYESTADYFIALAYEECTIFYRNAYWVEAKTIHGHLGDRLFRELECDVITWVPEQA